MNVTHHGEETSCQRLEDNADLADHENDFVVIHSMKIDITSQAKNPFASKQSADHRYQPAPSRYLYRLRPGMTPVTQATHNRLAFNRDSLLNLFIQLLARDC
jgi:hypothetical protein